MEICTQQIFCLPFSSQAVLTVETHRKYTELDDAKSSIMAIMTNHGTVGTIASANSPHFHPTVLMAIKPNMQMMVASIEGHICYKTKQNGFPLLTLKVVIIPFMLQ